MTDIEALLRERDGYLAKGRLDRVAQVDAVLAQLGVKTTTDDLPAEVESAVPGTARVERAVPGRPKRR